MREYYKSLIEEMIYFSVGIFLVKNALMGLIKILLCSSCNCNFTAMCHSLNDFVERTIAMSFFVKDYKIDKSGSFFFPDR